MREQFALDIHVSMVHSAHRPKTVLRLPTRVYCGHRFGSWFPDLHQSLCTRSYCGVVDLEVCVTSSKQDYQLQMCSQIYGAEAASVCKHRVEDPPSTA